MSRFLPIFDPSWLLLAGVAILAFVLPILTQVRRLGADVLEDTSTLVTSHVSCLACAFLAYRFTGIRGGLAILLIWGGLVVAVQFLGGMLTPHSRGEAPPEKAKITEPEKLDPDELSQHLLRLDRGWNLVSIPFRLLNDDPERALEPGVVCWSWNADTQSYERPSHLTPGMAIWIYSREQKGLDLYGYTPDLGERRLRPGWNLVGPLQRIEAPRNQALRGSPWSFEQQRAIAADELEPGKGYWIFASEFVDLLI